MTDRPPVAADAEGVTADWRGLVARGRYDLAAQAYRLTDGPDGVLRTSLDALADAIAATRDKQWRSAQQAIERLGVRHDELPWSAIDLDLDALRQASAGLDAREIDLARSHLERADGTGFPAEAATLLGTLAVFEGETERARGHFEAALELDPNHFRALTNLGNILLDDGDVDGAIAAYERAIRLNDGFANAHHNLGVAYRRKGQVAKSVRALRRAQREANRRDAVLARERLGTRRPGAGGSARTLRWIIIAAMAAAVWWLIAQRGP